MSQRKDSHDGADEKSSDGHKKATEKDEPIEAGIPWFRTKGLEHVLDVLVLEAADIVRSEPLMPILVTGPTGVGKTYVTEKIINEAGIVDGVKRVNCAAFAQQLVESELFGHVKGAFTDAKQNTTGVLADPNCKLIVLEELGTLPKHIQAKLLIFLETGEIRKIGSNEVKTLPRIPKIIGVTNSPPDSQDFREDFLFRFHIITIPGLHSRRHDIPELLQSFLPGFQWSNLDTLRLMCYNWPGNVRQLRRFTYLVERYQVEITDSTLSVVEWFDKRFSRMFDIFPRGPRTPGVPHMKGLTHLSEFLDRYSDIWKEIGHKVPEFHLLSPEAYKADEDEPPYKTPFDSVDLERAWHRWCYIVRQDEFADMDLWESLISRKRTSSVDPLEGDLMHDERPHHDIEDLSDRFSKLWYGNSHPSDKNHTETSLHGCPIKMTLSNPSLKPSQEKKEELTIDQALRMVLEEYSPKGYGRAWDEHTSPMTPKDVASKYGLNPKSVTQARYRDKQRKIKSSNNDDKSSQ